MNFLTLHKLNHGCLSIWGSACSLPSPLGIEQIHKPQIQVLKLPSSIIQMCQAVDQKIQ